jgi:hypothetical protein
MTPESANSKFINEDGLLVGFQYHDVQAETIKFISKEIVILLKNGNLLKFLNSSNFYIDTVKEFVFLHVYIFKSQDSRILKHDTHKINMKNGLNSNLYAAMYSVTGSGMYCNFDNFSVFTASKSRE